jgi:hypothetical protein
MDDKNNQLMVLPSCIQNESTPRGTRPTPSGHYFRYFYSVVFSALELLLPLLLIQEANFCRLPLGLHARSPCRLQGIELVTF